MTQNRGKDFESVFQKCCEQVEDLSIDRLHDQTSGYAGSTNICDFIVYKYPYEYYFECKSTHSNTFSIHSNPKKDKYGREKGFYGNISDKQWEGLSEKIKIDGVMAGVVIWFIDKDVTVFIPINELQRLYDNGIKSVHYSLKDLDNYIVLKGKKKRVFFDYDMEHFFTLLDDYVPLFSM